MVNFDTPNRDTIISLTRDIQFPFTKEMFSDVNCVTENTRNLPKISTCF